MKIQPQYLTLSDLLGKRMFRIPEYQRCYSWTRKQRADLFADIRSLRTAEDKTHFMATIVGLRREPKTIVTDEFQIIEVVDGQQRLTTLVILYRAISKALNRTDTQESEVARQIDQLLIKGDDLSLLLLQTNHDTCSYFVNYLRKGQCTSPNAARSLADRNLLRAIEECEAFVDEWQGDLVRLVGILKNRLGFILHEIDEESTVYTVFEVLNSRGLDVAWLDRLKSIVMGIAFESGTGNQPETIHELHTIWKNIYSCIGLHQGRGAETLRFAATLKNDSVLSRVLSEERAVETLRVRCKTAKDTVEVSEWVLRVSKAVESLVEDRRRAAVTKIAHARLLAVAIELRSDFEGPTRESLLRQWEKVTFRIFGMCGKDARTGVGDYVKLAWRVAKEKIPTANVLGRLQSLAGSKFAIAAAVKKLENEQCYRGWEEELRYFLYRYEEYLSRRAGQTFQNEQWDRIWRASRSTTIEHVMAQSSGAPWIDRLGNLLLLPPGLNSELGAKLPAGKAEAYRKTGLLIAGELAEELPGWSEQAVKDREARLLAWAADEWAD